MLVIHLKCFGVTEILSVQMSACRGYSETRWYISPPADFIVSDFMKELVSFYLVTCGNRITALKESVHLLMDESLANITAIDLYKRTRLGMQRWRSPLRIAPLAPKKSFYNFRVCFLVMQPSRL